MSSGDYWLEIHAKDGEINFNTSDENKPFPCSETFAIPTADGKQELYTIFPINE